MPPYDRPMFAHPDEAIAALEKDGFDWRHVREYFRFTDDWLREGEYGRLLDAAMASLPDDEARDTLLDMLDLQYSVFLEQVALQDRMLKNIARGRAAANTPDGGLGNTLRFFHADEKVIDDVSVAGRDSVANRERILALKDKALRHLARRREAASAAFDEDRYESVAFGERVMAYLQINSNSRPGHFYRRRNARSALLHTPVGTLIDRLLGHSTSSVADDDNDNIDS